MRKDCTIDNRVVIARNASLLAGGRVRVKRGDAFTYSDNGREYIARSLGRVSSPALPGYDDSGCKGFILAMVASADFSFAFERWVNPDNVTRVFDSPANMARFFFTPSLPYSSETMRTLMEHGTTMERYVSNHATRVAEMNREKESRKHSS